MKRKKNKTENRKESKTPLERELEVILSGGSVITAEGEQITSYNCPRSYSEAVRRGLNFYMSEES